jgi:hypothetical protein
MPRYVVLRALGDITDDQLDAAAENATRVREAEFPDVSWEHSHVTRTGDGALMAYCVYAAPSPQHVRDHAAAAGLPADDVQEIERDLMP